MGSEKLVVRNRFLEKRIRTLIDYFIISDPLNASVIALESCRQPSRPESPHMKEKRPKNDLGVNAVDTVYLRVASFAVRIISALNKQVTLSTV